MDATGAKLSNRTTAVLLLSALLCTAGWELVAGWQQHRAVARPEDFAAAAKAIRSEFQPGDLITIAPLWADALGRAELGDLMPLPMVGRADGRAYRRIFELSLRGARSDDTTGLTVESFVDFGRVRLARYSQTPVAVPYDLVEHFAEAQSSGGLVERRTLEIDYRPRYGLSLSLAQQQKTVVLYNNIPDEAWRSAELRLWLGLHDYYARKNARGPAEVVVDLDDGATRTPITVQLSYPTEQKLMPVTIALPKNTNRPQHAIRIEASAQSAVHHFVGVLGRLETVTR